MTHEEKERQAILEALSDWMADESFEQLTERIVYRLSELRKPSEGKHLTAKEIEAVEKAARATAKNIIVIEKPDKFSSEKDIRAAEYFGCTLFKIGAEFALSELHKPSESKLDLAQLEKQLDDALNAETKESLTEWLLKQRKPSEDLVNGFSVYKKTATVKAKIFEKGDEDGMIHRDGMLGAMEDSKYGLKPDLVPYISTIENKHLQGDFGKNYLCIGVDGERWLVEKSIFERTYEIANLAPFQVNAELLEALKNIRLAIEDGYLVKTVIDDDDYYDYIIKCIQNAESRIIANPSKTCKQ